jgi:MFS family permease
MKYSALSYPVGMASDRLMGGQRKPFIYLACFMLSGVMFAMIFASTMHQMVILCMILGAANGIYLTTETSLAVDALPHARRGEEEETSSSVSGGDAQLLGLWGIASFIGSALGPLIGGPLLYFFGSEKDQLDEGQDYSIRGYALVLGLSALYFLLSALALQGVKRPSTI